MAITAKLGVKTCDICRKPMRKNQPVIIIASGSVSTGKEELDFHGDMVQYACHTSCWNQIGNEDI